jgi:hypothetical protein
MTMQLSALGGSGGRAGKPAEERQERLRSQEMAMPFYRDHIYPGLVQRLGNPAPIRKIRERIVPWAQGTVLEIGVGSGGNFIHYDPAKVSKLYALEPNRGVNIPPLKRGALSLSRRGLATFEAGLRGSPSLESGDSRRR